MLRLDPNSHIHKDRDAGEEDSASMRRDVLFLHTALRYRYVEDAAFILWTAAVWLLEGLSE